MLKKKLDIYEARQQAKITTNNNNPNQPNGYSN